MKHLNIESNPGLGNIQEIIEEIERLIKRAMEVIGRDRVEFSHMLLGANLADESPKVEKALALFEKIPNTNPQKSILANKLGVILNALRLPEKAEEYFRRALVLLPGSSRPERAWIESNLFHAYINKGNFEAALSYMMQSLEAENEECNLFDVERYAPIRILGVGGMGVTFLCNDNYEERKVVVKTLWRNVTGTLKEVFSEAFTAKKIKDPRVLRFYDIRRHKGNKPFIVMEYFDGPDLQRYLEDERKGNPLEVKEALSIIAEVADTLSVVHNQDMPIIHRDIKPNNILYDPKTGEIKIIDFGIACMLPNVDEISRTLEYKTSNHSLIAKNIAGTWGYMAPEQQFGGSKLDPRVDVFGLGKTFMFLITGKTPPPENIFALSPDVRELVGEFVGYCLMPHAQDRYTAAQVVEKIAQILERAMDMAHSKLAKQAEMSAEATTTESPGFEISYGEATIEEESNEEGYAAALPIDASALPVDAAAIMAEVPNELYASLSLDDAIGIVEPVQSENPIEEVMMATEVPDNNDDFGDIFAEEVEDSFDKEPKNSKPSSPKEDSLGGDLDDLEQLESVIISADDLGGTEEPSDSSLGFGGESTVISPDEWEAEASNDQEEMIPEGGMDLSQMGLDLEESSDEAPNDLVFDLSEEEEDTFAPMEIGIEDAEPEDAFSPMEIGATPMAEGPGVGRILVKEEKDSEICSMSPTQALAKVSLPMGYIWEGDMIMCEKDGATMVHVPAGGFIMGYEGDGTTLGEGPEHEAILNAYLIDECPVTWYQYNHFCEETGHPKPVLPSWELDESQPVINVTWEDATAYAQWAGKSLPTEAQWEKAARGGSFFDGDNMMIQKNQAPHRIYPWGDEAPDSGMQWKCNYRQEPKYGEWSPSPVGSYMDAAAPYGCLDMAGNVWEWCRDWYSDIYYQSAPASNPQGPRTGEGRTVRGGAFNSDPCHLRVTFRSFMEPNDWWNVVGFRTVKEIL